MLVKVILALWDWRKQARSAGVQHGRCAEDVLRVVTWI